MHLKFFHLPRLSWITRLICSFVLTTFILSNISPYSARAQLTNSQPLNLVQSSVYQPAVIQGMTVYPDNPLKFDFIVDAGDSKLTQDALKSETQKLIKYFIASLATPEKDMWVNLSPHEPDRIIPAQFGATEMGRDLLSQDYLLKQLTASLMNPQGEAGKKFWDKVYSRIYEEHGTTDIPVDTFNKVWIVPSETSVYESPATNTVFVAESKLDVMLEEDYLASAKVVSGRVVSDKVLEQAQNNNFSTLALYHSTTDIKSLIRDIILPEIRREVNEGEIFAPLRQIMNSLILARWYKDVLKTSILNQAFADQEKTAGVRVDDPQANQKIYEQYVQAFSQGAYDILKEEYDPSTSEMVTRKYFSGGIIPVVQVNKASLVPARLVNNADLNTASVDFAMMKSEHIWAFIAALVVIIASVLVWQGTNGFAPEYQHHEWVLQKKSDTIYVEDYPELDVEGDYQSALTFWKTKFVKSQMLRRASKEDTDYLRVVINQAIKDFLSDKNTDFTTYEIYVEISESDIWFVSQKSALVKSGEPDLAMMSDQYQDDGPPDYGWLEGFSSFEKVVKIFAIAGAIVVLIFIAFGIFMAVSRAKQSSDVEFANPVSLFVQESETHTSQELFKPDVFTAPRDGFDIKQPVGTSFLKISDLPGMSINQAMMAHLKIGKSSIYAISPVLLFLASVSLEMRMFGTIELGPGFVVRLLIFSLSSILLFLLSSLNKAMMAETLYLSAAPVYLAMMGMGGLNWIVPAVTVLAFSAFFYYLLQALKKDHKKEERPALWASFWFFLSFVGAITSFGLKEIKEIKSTLHMPSVEAVILLDRPQDNDESVQVWLMATFDQWYAENKHRLSKYLQNHPDQAKVLYRGAVNRFLLNDYSGELSEICVRVAENSQSIEISEEDEAMMNVNPVNGGIDLERLNVGRADSGESSIKIHFKNDPAMLEKLRNATGLRAIMHDMKPVTSPVLNKLLGLNADGREKIRNG